MRSNRIKFTRYTFENKGGFYDQMPLKASSCADTKIAKVPLKTATDCFQDCGRYGGYDNEKGAYFFLVDYIEKKKHVRAFRHVPVRLASAIRRNPERLLQYCRDSKTGLGLEKPKILIDRIPFNSKLIFDGFPFVICGRQNNGTRIQIKHCLQLVIPDEFVLYLKKVLLSVDSNECSVEIVENMNIQLYQLFVNKARNTVYHRRPASQLETLEIGLDIFKSLSLIEQCNALKNILILFTCSTQGATNMSLIGGKSNVGSMTYSIDITKLESAYLEHQTPTGLTCTRIDLKALK
jgi:hypothetical protein